MRNWQKTLNILFFVVIFAASFQHHARAEGLIDPIPVIQQAASKPLQLNLPFLIPSQDKSIWLYRLKYRNKCSYIAGYIHRGLNISDLNPLIINRLTYANDVYIELNEKDLNSLVQRSSESRDPLLDRLLAAAPEAIREKQTRKTFDFLAQTINLSGIDEVEPNKVLLDRTEPYLAMSYLISKLLFSPDETSFDSQIIAYVRSQAQGKRVFSLDTVSSHMNALELAYPTEQLYDFAHNLRLAYENNEHHRFLRSKRRAFDSISRAFLSGNRASIENKLGIATYSEDRKRAHAERNEEWARTIYNSMWRQRRQDFNLYFGGVSHLMGDDSVFKFLEGIHGIEKKEITVAMTDEIFSKIRELSGSDHQYNDESAESTIQSNPYSDPCLREYFGD